MNKVLFLSLLAFAFSATLNLETARKEILSKHNEYRALHQVGDLTRLSDLETIAQNYAETLSASGNFEHSSNKYNGDYLGENLYMGYISENIGYDTVNLWYSEYPKYDFSNPGWNYDAGHFTQVVWKSTKYLGCGVSCTSSNMCYVCCNYYPSGNYYGEFANNVFDKSSSSDTTAVDTTVADTTVADTTVIDTTSEDTTATDTDTSSTSSDTTLEKFREDAKNRHNVLRAQHKAGKLVRDTLLEKYAMENAKKMAAAKNWFFTEEKYNGEYIGQCIFWNYGDPNGAGVTDMWYNEIENYDFNNPGFNMDAGDFTQVVWKNTKKIGCGYACSGRDCYGSCLYYPSGNYLNQFEANVLPKS